MATTIREEVKMSDLLDEEPKIGVSTCEYKKKRLYYEGEIYVDEMAEIEKEIKKLQERHRILGVESVKKQVKPPKGWEVAVIKTYGTTIKYQIYRTYYEEKPKEAAKPVVATPKAPTPPRKPTRLDLMLRVVDSKTLFNSGLLSKEEKKKLIDEYVADQERNNQ